MYADKVLEKGEDNRRQATVMFQKCRNDPSIRLKFTKQLLWGNTCSTQSLGPHSPVSHHPRVRFLRLWCSRRHQFPRYLPLGGAPPHRVAHWWAADHDIPSLAHELPHGGAFDVGAVIDVGKLNHEDTDWLTERILT